MEFAVLGGTVFAGLPHLCLLVVSLVTYAQLVMNVQMGQTPSWIADLEPTGIYAHWHVAYMMLLGSLCTIIYIMNTS